MTHATSIVAYCGLVCSDCSAYIATQQQSEAALARVAEQWRREYGLSEVSIADVTCDGCLDATGRKGRHCAECDIRACAVDRGVVNCAHCDAYVCDRLAAFLTLVPPARAKLAEIRAAL